MKQLLLDPSSGQARVEEVPAPEARPGFVLVRNGASLVSAGTERTAVEFSRSSLLAKARSRPDLVRKVVAKARTDGVLTAWEAARARLDQPLLLGYSSAGTVLAVGEGVEGIAPGDRVACAGAGYAVHGEVVCVPRNLVAPVPDGVPPGAAAFATVGAVGLHGFRLAEVKLGETVAVIGLGLVGLLAVQMARAAGCRVLGVDVDARRGELARELGAHRVVVTGSGSGDPLAEARDMTGGAGVDAVIIAAATRSSEPVELAGELARERGRVVVVGAVGMEIPRNVYYEKELELQVSRSYGPGRYDPLHEEKGMAYPIGYVRWTEGRNLEAFLELVSRGEVRTEPLVTHRFSIEDGAGAYELLAGDEPYLGVLLEYPSGDGEWGLDGTEPARRVRVADRPPAEDASAGVGVGVGVGVLGAGNFATSTLLPAMEGVEGLRMVGIASASGTSARHAAGKFGFGYAAGSQAEVLDDGDVSLVTVLTRHGLHAPQVVAALERGKDVFCEKPLCLDRRELEEILAAYAASREARGRPPLLAVGFNRRFAPMAVSMRTFLAETDAPLVLHYRVNAGYLPADHWVHDPEEGGGRIIGEACHFVDFLSFLTGSVPVRVSCAGLPDQGRYRSDNVVLTLDFRDGSVGTVTYVAAGDTALGKERCEAFGGGRSAVLDDFRTLERYRNGRRTVERSRLRQDKGHRGEWEAVGRVLREGGELPVSLESLAATSLATFGAVESLRTGEPVELDARGLVARLVGEEGS